MKVLHWLIPVAAVGGLFGLVSVAHAMHGPQQVGPMPEALKKKIAHALAGADPSKMRSVASEARSDGYPGQAQTLENAANAIEARIRATPNVTKETLHPKAESQPVSPDERKLAGRVALAFTGQTAGTEGADAQALLKRYQEIEKAREYYRGNIDGLYGPKSALSLALDHHIVPPPPLYWPRKASAASKQNYIANLRQLAAGDSQRAEEWNQAANAIA